VLPAAGCFLPLAVAGNCCSKYVWKMQTVQYTPHAKKNRPAGHKEAMFGLYRTHVREPGCVLRERQQQPATHAVLRRSAAAKQ
jgi:hypothetical protein